MKLVVLVVIVVPHVSNLVENLLKYYFCNRLPDAQIIPAACSVLIHSIAKVFCFSILANMTRRESQQWRESESVCFYSFMSSPQSTITISSTGRSESPFSHSSICRTTSIPLTTCPNTTCLPSKWGVSLLVIKN